MPKQAASAAGGRSRLIALTSLMASVVFLVTAAFSLYIPETRGYFNFGESAVYLSSIILPPGWAALAGGIGSMMADVVLGYYHYAPATLLIKGAEAFIASALVRRRPKAFAGRGAAVNLLLSIPLPILIGLFGLLLYTGTAELFFALPFTPLAGHGTLQLAGAVWLAAASVLGVYLVYANLKRVGDAWTLLSFLSGGAAMVLGYFLYEQLILGVAAIAEVPFNLMQVLVGVSVALPAAHRLRRLSAS